VGSAVNLYDRLCEHLYRNGSISNLHLQAAITKHGLENFEFFVIEFVADKMELITVEQKYIDRVPSNLRYNFNPTAGSRLGTTHTTETKAAISKALKGNTNRVGSTHSPEAKAAISDSLKGHTHSAETKAAIGAAKSKAVYVYDSKDVLVGTYPSHTEAAKFLGVLQPAVSKLMDSGRRNRKGFLITSAPISS
jgi:group I intron endonuclease